MIQIIGRTHYPVTNTNIPDRSRKRTHVHDFPMTSPNTAFLKLPGASAIALLASCIGEPGAMSRKDPPQQSPAPTESPANTQTDTGPKSGKDPAPSGAVRLSGEVVPGVSCPALKLADGSTVALSHLPAPFKMGDRVTVTGSGYGGSMTCMQKVLLVTGVRAGD